MLELLDQIVDRCRRGESLAVCAVVQTRGSTPQKAGAVMLVLGDGKTIGTIGGGCVEAEVRGRALQLIVDRKDRLLRFDLNHDMGWDDGLVCGGSMQVAVQVIDRDSVERYVDAREQLMAGNEAELTISVPDDSDQPARFVLPLMPVPTLVIAGAGHVGSALAAIVGQMDFAVIAIDDRADYLSADRFPHATRVVGDVDVELARLRITNHTYVVIVTRGHKRDALALAAVVKSNARYVGLIGSKRKIARIFADLAEQGITAEQLKKIHAPIGLNLGAVTPAEIAVSIAAELIAARRGSTETVNSAMRLKPGQIDRIIQ